MDDLNTIEQSNTGFSKQSEQVRVAIPIDMPKEDLNDANFLQTNYRPNDVNLLDISQENNLNKDDLHHSLGNFESLSKPLGSNNSNIQSKNLTNLGMIDSGVPDQGELDIDQERRDQEMMDRGAREGRHMTAEEELMLRNNKQREYEAEAQKQRAEEGMESLKRKVEQEEKIEEEARKKKEAERLKNEQEKKEAERLRAEQEKDAERAERIRIEKEQEAERIQVEKEEAERIRVEKEEAERIRAEQKEAERIRAELDPNIYLPAAGLIFIPLRKIFVTL